MLYDMVVFKSGAKLLSNEYYVNNIYNNDGDPKQQLFASQAGKGDILANFFFDCKLDDIGKCVTRAFKLYNDVLVRSSVDKAYPRTISIMNAPVGNMHYTKSTEPKNPFYEVICETANFAVPPTITGHTFIKPCTDSIKGLVGSIYVSENSVFVNMGKQKSRAIHLEELQYDNYFAKAILQLPDGRRVARYGKVRDGGYLDIELNRIAYRITLETGQLLMKS